MAITKARWIGSYILLAAAISFAGDMFAPALEWKPLGNVSVESLSFQFDHHAD